MLIGAIFAFLPVLAVDSLLDGWVRAHEASKVHAALDAVAAEAQAAVYEGLAAIRTVVAESPSLCTPTFLAHARGALIRSPYLRQIVVEGGDGVRYCDAYDGLGEYEVLSSTLGIPGHAETLTAVMLPGFDAPSLRITYTPQQARQVSAIVHLSDRFGAGRAPGLSHAALTRLALANGTELIVHGDVMLLDRSSGDTDHIFAHAFAGEVPIRAEAVVPFAAVRAGYVDLDVALTIVACIMSASFLMLALHYVRRSQLPAFDLERAIALGELKPYYQPVIDLTTGRLVGCEMLTRWVKPNGKMISPGAFIEYAEVTGLAIPMTIALMEQVRADLDALCAEMPDIKVSINLFEGHFRDGAIIEDVQAIFGGSRISYRQLAFEITERQPLANSAQANAVIAGLRALGCRLAMDDVGTGHSNLAYMQTLGMDIIKIDRVFIDMVRGEDAHVPVLDGLIVMARDLGTEIIAEGVETDAQARYLRRRGVSHAQGFLFSPALPAEKFIALARALNAEPAPDQELPVTAAA